MRNVIWMTVVLGLFATPSLAQDYGYGNYGFHGGMPYDSIGTPIPSATEPLYQYDDQEVWKHGWLQINPYEHGYHSYRPYNYKQVFAQAAQSSVWGMPSTMPYSQSYYLRYGPLTGINGQPIPAGIGPTPGYRAPGPGGPVPGYGMPTSMYSTSPLRQQPFSTVQSVPPFAHTSGLTPSANQQLTAPAQPVSGYQQQQLQVISPTTFQQFHNSAASGPEFQRHMLQKAQMQQMLQQGSFSR